MAANDTFRLKVVSPRGIALDSEVRSVLVQTLDGQVGILPGHCGYVALLGSGSVGYDGVQGSGSIYVTGGSVNFHEGVLTVLADSLHQKAPAGSESHH
jgi:F-type H+-transporting ATPase subunit epsilon